MTAARKTARKTIDHRSGTQDHLSAEQIDSALVGDLAAEAAGHLGACSACQRQLAEARMPLESFKAVTLAWSERRSATLPLSLDERVLHAATGARRAWGSAVVALLAVMVAIPFVTHHEAGRQAESSTETAQVQAMPAVGATGVVLGQVLAGEANAEQIARDNQMLNEIDLELDSSGASSEAMELQEVRRQVSSHADARTVQD